MFDISHMGVLRLEGTNPKDALQQLYPATSIGSALARPATRCCSMPKAESVTI